MVHSVPHYPPSASDGYGYPDTGHKYGQMYLCITLNSTAVMNGIGLQLRYNNPHIHDQHLPESMEEDFPNIYQLVQGIFDNFHFELFYFFIISLNLKINFSCTTSYLLVEPMSYFLLQFEL